MAGEYEVAEHHEAVDEHGNPQGQDATGDHAEGELMEELGHEEAGAHDAPFPPFDPEFYVPQLVWLVITFGLLYLLMSRLALPRVAGVIENRRETIAGDLDKANELQSQAAQAQTDYEQALADARAKSLAIANENREKMKAEANDLRGATDAKLEEQLNVAEVRIAETKEKAMANVRDVAAETAVTIVHHLTGDAADAQTVVAAVDGAMKEGH